MGIVVLFIYFIILFSLQTSFIDLFSVAGVTPDFALILSVYCAIILREKGGMGTAASLGFVQDCLSGGLLGVNTLSKSLIGFTFSTLKRQIVMEGFMPIFMFLFAASFFDGLIFYIATVVLFDSQVPAAFFFFKLPVYALYNSLVGPVLFYFLDWNKNLLVKRFPGLEGDLS